MGFVKYISYEYRGKWLSVFLFILLINYILVDFYVLKFLHKSKMVLYPLLLTIILFIFYGQVQWLDVMITSLFYWVTILIYEKVFLLNRRSFKLSN